MVNGVVSFDNPAAQLANGSRTERRFSKVNSSFSRLQKLNLSDSLYAALTLQWASRKLDSSEKMAVGGASSVRAANASALSGDMGALLNLEYGVKAQLDKVLGTPSASLASVTGSVRGWLEIARAF